MDIEPQPLLEGMKNGPIEDSYTRTKLTSQHLEDLDQRQILLSTQKSHHQQSNHLFASNVIRTSKYNIINFIPLNLMSQFSKISNVYFLINAGLSTIKMISITAGKPIMLIPLTSVVLFSMGKDAFEDYNRHKNDNKENKIEAMVVARNGVKCLNWEDIRVGDIVKVKDNQQIPCDMVIIRSSDSKGVCYTETKGLDGETNLKMKNAPKQLQHHFSDISREQKQESGSYKGSDSKSGASQWSGYDTESGLLERIQKIDGEIICEKPNNTIYKFEGNLKVSQIQERIPLGPENLLLRGCSLKNTEFVYGIAVFTGHDTKVMRNAASAKYKFSSLERKMNMAIGLILMTQLILSSIAALIGAAWTYKASMDLAESPACARHIPSSMPSWCSLQKEYYLDLDKGETQEAGFPFFQKFGTWILIFTNFVPISLMVTKEFVALMQCVFMQYDLNMFDQSQDMEMSPQASNLNEELGQIEYVFSDKTGTLTCNVMQFKKFSAGLISYGQDHDEDQDKQIDNGDKKHENVNFQDPLVQEHIHEGRESLIRVLMFLATCHTIVIDQKKGSYNSTSPDELALVAAAKEIGYEFCEKDENQNVVVKETRNGVKHKFKLLNVCEFTSTRKRQSCIYRDEKGKIILMCKGADAIIADLLSKESKQGEIFDATQGFVDEFAREGLRTLFLAERYISEQEYNTWNKKAQAAQLEVNNREEKVSQVDELIEHDLELIGSTAIEDKLQDEVAETIEFMKDTGIKVWVLTGDKIETAINIGISAKLLDDSMDQYIIDDTDISDIRQSLKELQERVELAQLADSPKKQAIIVAGHSLIQIEASFQAKQIFLEVSDKSDVVLACRVSPKQKADIVQMIKTRFPEKVTLSIGDGANDVSMILKAHVGVGILGKEGQQAARSADFSIGQFKFLKPLLFVHGREAYRRISMLILYSFYKNIFFVVTQFFFGYYSAFAGQPLYEKIIYQLYNIAMTSWPINWYAMFDFEFEKDRKEDTKINIYHDQSSYQQGDEILFMRNPNLYKQGMEDKCFNKQEMLKWISYAIFHAFIAYLLCFFVITGDGSIWASPKMTDGKDNGFWVAGHVVFTSTVFVSNWTLVHQYHIHHLGGIALMSLMLFCNFFFLALESEWFEPTLFADVLGIYSPMFKQPITWLSLLLMVAQVSIFETVSQRMKDLKEEVQREKFIQRQSVKLSSSLKLAPSSLNFSREVSESIDKRMSTVQNHNAKRFSY